MKKRAILGLVLTLAIIASAFAMTPASADCEVVGKQLAAGGFYVEVRDGGGSVWLYEESNGLEGLQRGGSSWILSDDNDTCNDIPDGFVPDKLWV